MRLVYMAGLCLVAMLVPRTAQAQVEWQAQGGARFWTNAGDRPVFATAGVDASLGRGLFVGADTTIRPGMFGIVGQGGYQTPRPERHGPQGYLLAAVGVGVDDSSTELLSNIGGGARYWLSPRLAPFVDFRALFVHDPDWSGPAHQLSFGVTVRLGS